MSIPIAIAILLAVAVLAGALRQLWRWRHQPASSRLPSWRIAGLLLLQLLGAALLYATLLPPQRPPDHVSLVVMTADAGPAALREAATGTSIVVALPEADHEAVRAAGALRMPDLATALRQHPRASALHVLGAGLEARDLDAARGMAIDFSPAPLPRGLVELHAPARVVSGAMLRVSGRVHDVADGRVELLDPAGVVQDRGAVDPEGRFLLKARVRASGPAIYRLRLRDGAVADAGADPGIVADVPVDARPGGATRLLLLAGAPNPEVKYLRRWASDAGLDLHSRMALGGGVVLGDGPVAFDQDALAGFDLVIVDERSWGGLGASARSALLAAVDRGLGLMLRITGTPDAGTRDALQRLGFALGDADPVLDGDVVLDADGGADSDATRPAPDGLAQTTDMPVPALVRQPHRILAPDSVPLLEDATGTPLARWRQSGRGRVAVWNLGQSFRLVLTGHGQRHARLWGEAAGTLARPRAAPLPHFEGIARQGQRATLCNVAPGTALVAEDGTRLHPLPDPAANGCAAVWPTHSGWQRVGGGDGAPMLYVHPADALPGVAALGRRDATQRLAASTEAHPTAPGSGATQALPFTEPTTQRAAGSGPRWPWFLSWLLASGLLWWLERTRRPRPA